MSPAVVPDIRKRIDLLAEQIKTGAVAVPTDWNGPEFANPN